MSQHQCFQYLDRTSICKIISDKPSFFLFSFSFSARFSHWSFFSFFNICLLNILTILAAFHCLLTMHPTKILFFKFGAIVKNVDGTADVIASQNLPVCFSLLPICHTPFLIYYFVIVLTLFRMGIFGASYGWGGQKGPPSLKSVTNILQWWNLEQLYLTSQLYLRRIKKYMNHVTHLLSSADISIFSPEISKYCDIKIYRYRLHFDT